LNTTDKFDLQRFIGAQEGVYANVISELKAGQKRTHWMWFIFPQIDGLGMSPTSKYYALRSLDEAQAYLEHPLLGSRLIECSKVILELQGLSALHILGHPDDLKLRSSMTLFSRLDSAETVFELVLAKYFGGEPDVQTLQMLHTTSRRR
jgi:uncharacterized protein (DUF1810 family)